MGRRTAASEYAAARFNRLSATCTRLEPTNIRLTPGDATDGGRGFELIRTAFLALIKTPRFSNAEIILTAAIGMPPRRDTSGNERRVARSIPRKEDRPSRRSSIRVPKRGTISGTASSTTAAALIHKCLPTLTIAELLTTSPHPSPWTSVSKHPFSRSRSTCPTAPYHHSYSFRTRMSRRTPSPPSIAPLLYLPIPRYL